MSPAAERASDGLEPNFADRPGFPHLVRLVCLDIDGTLLDSSSRLREGVRAAVVRAARTGLHITLSTGRNLDSTLPIVAALGVTPSIISSGGSHLRSSAGRTQEITLSPEEAQYIAGIGLDNGSGLFIDYAERSWAMGAEDYLSLYSHLSHSAPMDLIPDPWIPAPLKISLINERGALDRMKPEILALYPDLQMASPFENVVDITPQASTKGNALRALAGMLDISLIQTAAVGDSENDLSNFAVAGLSIAMGNAPVDVKLAADWVAPPNDQEGAAWALDRILESNKQIAIPLD